MTQLFHLAAGTSPLLISFPHVGTFLPEDLSPRMTPEALVLADTDWHVDRLYDFASGLGAGTLIATHSRYVVDLNRDPDGRALYPGQENSEVVPLSTFSGAPIYRGDEAPDLPEIRERIERYWRPYHAALTQELNRIKRQYGFAILWDAHSIASELPRFFVGRIPDLNLGSAKGISASPTLIEQVSQVLKAASPFSWVLDGRFTGGYITRHFGRPSEEIHALQLEMAQTAYMDEVPPYRYDADRAIALKGILSRLIMTVLFWAETIGHPAGHHQWSPAEPH